MRGVALVVLASARTEVADYISTVIYVYTLIIVLYIVFQLLFAFGGRLPYSRATDVLYKFLREVCEPFLGLFRRVLPRLGPFDFSPVVAILVLEAFNSLVVQGAIHG